MLLRKATYVIIAEKLKLTRILNHCLKTPPQFFNQTSCYYTNSCGLVTMSGCHLPSS